MNISTIISPKERKVHVHAYNHHILTSDQRIGFVQLCEWACGEYTVIRKGSRGIV